MQLSTKYYRVQDIYEIKFNKPDRKSCSNKQKYYLILAVTSAYSAETIFTGHAFTYLKSNNNLYEDSQSQGRLHKHNVVRVQQKTM